VHLIFRTLLTFLRRRPPLGITDVGSVDLHVLPTDLDFAGHMNNGVYLSIMDLGRIDLFVRAGVWWKILRAGISPVMANETITFRKSLKLWTRFSIESRVIGVDAKALYMEHRAVVRGEIYAAATMRVRFVKKTGGTATMDEVAAATGIDLVALPPAPWIDRWSADVALPPARGAAPSEWA
jgi:acyl-CoA thioesterase FadM